MGCAGFAIVVRCLSRIRYNELLERSETTEAIDYQESSFMYERELIHLVEKYKQVKEEGAGQNPPPIIAATTIRRHGRVAAKDGFVVMSAVIAS